MCVPRPQLPDLSDLDHLKSRSIEAVIKSVLFRASPGVQRLRLCRPVQGLWFQSLVGKLRTHALWNVNPPKKTTLLIDKLFSKLIK